MRTALIAGASGLVGRKCLYGLIESDVYDRVIALVRKPLNLKHRKLEEVIVDFDQLERYAEKMKADDVFCCLGTTINAAGSQERFRTVDLEYPLAVARICLRNGATQFLLNSAMGADRQSSIFYNRVKGELEEAVAALGYRQVKVFRPSLLLGRRPELRVGERIAQIILQPFTFLFIGPLKRYRPVRAEQVALKMTKAASDNRDGFVIYENETLV